MKDAWGGQFCQVAAFTMEQKLSSVKTLQVPSRWYDMLADRGLQNNTTLSTCRRLWKTSCNNTAVAHVGSALGNLTTSRRFCKIMPGTAIDDGNPRLSSHLCTLDAHGHANVCLVESWRVVDLGGNRTQTTPSQPNRCSSTSTALPDCLIPVVVERLHLLSWLPLDLSNNSWGN